MDANEPDAEGHPDDLDALDPAELSTLVARGRVVPVVGPELSLVASKHGLCDIQGDLAGKVGHRLGRAGTPCPRLAEVSSRLLRQPGWGRPRLTRLLADALEERRSQPVPTPLTQLAEILSFPLYLSTAIDGALARALEPRGPVVQQGRLTMFPELERLQTDASGPPTIYELFGRVDVDGRYVLTDEETLECICRFNEQLPQRPRLRSALHGSHLLFLGCGFPDWLYRFVVRILRGERLATTTRDVREFVADGRLSREAELSAFLRDHAAAVYERGDAAHLVEDVRKRWEIERRRVPRRCDDDGGFQVETPPEAVFISYASEDLVAASAVRDALRRAQVPTWMAEETAMQWGEDWWRTIERRIRSCILFVPVLSAACCRSVITDRPPHPSAVREFRREWALADSLSNARRAEPSSAEPGLAWIRPILLDATTLADAEAPSSFQRAHAVSYRPSHDGGSVLPDAAIAEIRSTFRALFARARGYAR